MRMVREATAFLRGLIEQTISRADAETWEELSEMIRISADTFNNAIKQLANPADDYKRGAIMEAALEAAAFVAGLAERMASTAKASMR